MAQHNIAHFYGMIQRDPTVTKDQQGNVTSASVYIATARSSRVFDDRNNNNMVEFDQVMLFSAYPPMAEQMSKTRTNDIVIIKGTVNTRNTPKIITCENCGNRFFVTGDGMDENPRNTGMITFVTPIELDIRDTGLTSEEAQAMLVAHREMSNEGLLVGRLCSDPRQWEGGNATAYQLGINRKFYVRDDDPSTHADFPYIRSYGKQAYADFDSLKKGSLVLVDGLVCMRRFLRSSRCPHCGQQKEWKDKVLEVVPYTVEYLDGYRTPQERQQGDEIGD